jgi:hypothetical protein
VHDEAAPAEEKSNSSLKYTHKAQDIELKLWQIGRGVEAHNLAIPAHSRPFLLKLGTHLPPDLLFPALHLS